MSDDQPPSEQLPIFNAVNFKGTSNQSLNFPIAQGVETFPSGIVFGDGTFQNTAAPSSGTFVQYPTAQGQVTFPSIAFADGTTQSTAANTSTNYIEFPTAQGLCSFPSGITNVGDITQLTGSTTLNSTTFNGTVSQAIGSTTLLNTTINGNSTFNGNLSQTTGNCTLQAAIINGSAEINGDTTIQTSFGTSSNANLVAQDNTTSRSIRLLPSVTAGAYNPGTEAGNIQILAFKNGSQGTETLELTTWSNTNSAVKIKPTSVEIGAGGTGVTGTSNIECDGTTVNVSPSLKVETNILLLEAALSSSSTLLGNSAISAGNYLTTLNPGSTATYALQQLSAGDNGSQSIIITAGGAFGQTKNTIQSYDSYRDSTLDLYLNPLGGDVFAPTVSTSDSSTKIATTAYVQNNLISYAPLASPALSGTPTAPTQTSTDNSTKIATTAFVQSHVATGYAPIDSPAFTGTPTAPTPSVSNNSTQLATTSFVQSLTNAGRGNPQPGYAVSAGYFYSGGVTELQTISFDLSNPAMNATLKQLCNVTLRITCRAEWDGPVGSPQYWNAVSNGEFILTVFPGRLPSSNWGSSRVYWANNSGGTPSSITGNVLTSALYSQTIWSFGSTIVGNSYVQPNGSNYNELQFCFEAPSGYNGNYSIQVEVIGSNVYWANGQGQVGVNFNNMTPTSGGGTSANYYPKLYG
jgi:hypothetical protein